MHRIVQVFARAVLMAALAITSGCSALAAVLPVLADIVMVVQDATQILDAIETFVDAYFLKNPNPVLAEKVAEAMGKTRAGLNMALRTTRGAQHLSQQEVDAAFTDFRVAYQELLTIVGPLGVQPQKAVKGPLLASNGEKLYVPDPLALTIRVEQ